MLQNSYACVFRSLLHACFQHVILEILISFYIFGCLVNTVLHLADFIAAVVKE